MIFRLQPTYVAMIDKYIRWVKKNNNGEVIGRYEALGRMITEQNNILEVLKGLKSKDSIFNMFHKDKKIGKLNSKVK